MLQTKNMPTSYNVKHHKALLYIGRLNSSTWAICRLIHHKLMLLLLTSVYMVELPRMLWVDSTAASTSPFSKLSIYNTRQNTSRLEIVALPTATEGSDGMRLCAGFGATKSGEPPGPRHTKISCVCVCPNSFLVQVVLLSPNTLRKLQINTI